MIQPSGTSKWLVPVAVWIGVASIAYAQSVSNQVSLPIDSGINTTVAPLPSTEIEPGAATVAPLNTAPIPVDVTGADLLANRMNPSIEGISFIRSRPNSVDTLVRDANTQTAIRQFLLQASRPTSVLGKPTSASAFAPALSGAGASSGLSQVPANSFMHIQSPAAQLQLPIEKSALTVSPHQKTMGTLQGSQLSGSANSASGIPHSGSAASLGVTSTGSRQPESQGTESPFEALDFSRMHSDRLSGSVVSDSPFGSFGDRDFLSPNILTPSRSSGSPRRSATYSKHSFNMPGSSSNRYAVVDRENLGKMGISRSERKVLQDAYRGDIKTLQRRTRWHNPMLQQMGNESNK